MIRDISISVWSQNKNVCRLLRSFCNSSSFILLIATRKKKATRYSSVPSSRICFKDKSMLRNKAVNLLKQCLVKRMVEMGDNIVVCPEMVSHLCTFEQRPAHRHHCHTLFMKNAGVVNRKYIRLNYKRQKRYITSRNTYSFLLPIYYIGT